MFIVLLSPGEKLRQFVPFLVLTQLLENMTEVVRKGIQEAQVQLQKANEERLLEEVSRLLPSPWPRLAARRAT